MQLISNEIGAYFYFKCKNPAKKKGTIIFIHGFATTSEYHDVFIQHIIDEFDYIAIQLPGAGYTEWNSKKKPKVEDMHNYCVDLIKTLNLKNFILLGHSMGGGLAVRVANTLKDKTICLICATPMNSKISVFKVFNYFKFNPKTFKKCFKLQNILYHDFLKTKNNDEVAIEEYVKKELDYQLKHYKFFTKLKKSMFSIGNMRKQSANERAISCPTLVIAGKYDSIIPPKSIFKAFDRKSDNVGLIRIELMNQSGHIPFQEQEIEYAKEVKDFIDLVLKTKGKDEKR